MRSFEKDVLMICKGHYNPGSHQTTFDAIKAYQAEWSGSDPQYLGDKEVFDFLFMASEDFLTTKNYRDLIKDKLMGKYSIRSFDRDPFEMSYRYMSELFIGQLALLRVRNNEGGWLIDLSDYLNGEKII